MPISGPDVANFLNFLNFLNFWGIGIAGKFDRDPGATASKPVAAILAKLGVDSRTAAVAIALRDELV